MTFDKYRWALSTLIWVAAALLLGWSAAELWGPWAAGFSIGVLAAFWIAVADLGYVMVLSRVVSADRLRAALHKHHDGQSRP
jgi:hypothetical protein